MVKHNTKNRPKHSNQSQKHHKNEKNKKKRKQNNEKKIQLPQQLSQQLRWSWAPVMWCLRTCGSLKLRSGGRGREVRGGVLKTNPFVKDQPRPPVRNVFSDVFCYIKATKKHPFGGPGRGCFVYLEVYLRGLEIFEDFFW